MADQTIPARQNRIRRVMATTQGKTYTVAIATFLLVFGMFFLAIRPAFLSITNQNAQNDIKRAYLTGLTEKETILKQLAQQEAELTSEIAYFEELYKIRQDDEFMLANIASIAKNYQCQLISVNFQKRQPSKDPQIAATGLAIELPITINATGSIENLQQFLSHLESFPRAIRIASLTFSTKKTNDSAVENPVSLADSFDLVIEANYYFFQEVQLVVPSITPTAAP